MFIEPQFRHEKKGWIEVICGSMFSGKTEELIRRLKRARIANKSVEIFKPTIDTRYDDEDIVSHDATHIKSSPVSNAMNILLLASDVEVVGVDEAQFFDDSLIQASEQLAQAGCRVIIAGLDMDYTGKPFGPMPGLLAVADYITKVHAICMQCGDIANYSYRLVREEGRILLGEKEKYEPRCRRCFHEGMARQQ